MTSSALIVAAIAVLPALGLALWIAFSVARATEALTELDGYNGLHFNE